MVHALGESLFRGQLEAVHICFWKVVPFCQEWLTGSFRERVGKTISEIEAGGMPTPAISAPSGARDFDLSGIHGHDLNVEPMKKEIEFAACHYTPAGLKQDGRLQSIWGGEQTRAVLLNEFEKLLPLGFSEKDGDESGSADNHQ
jgi:hypothetical protein